MASAVLPKSDVDLFCDEVLTDPYPHYRALRDAGPVVYLEQTDAWAITRYDGVRAALKDWQNLTSTEGIAFNPIHNSNTKGMIITSEGPEHDHLRSVLNDRLKLGAVRELTVGLARQADELVARLVERGSFDGVADLARVFPSQVVAGLLGMAEDVSDKLFHWGDASFTAVGPLNDRTNAAFGVLAELFEFMAGVTKDDFVEGSIGRMLYEAGEAGQIPPELCAQMMWNFTGAGADTTMAALGHTVQLLARDPKTWAELRADPALIPAAVNEVLRYEASLQIWGRKARDDRDVDGSVIPAGSRVALLLGSGNRDERHYPDADTFDLRRNSRDHLSFGFGMHICVGAPLARAQLVAVVEAMVRHIELIEVGEPTRHLNNVVRSLETLPVTVVKAAS